MSNSMQFTYSKKNIINLPDYLKSDKNDNNKNILAIVNNLITKQSELSDKFDINVKKQDIINKDLNNKLTTLSENNNKINLTILLN